MNKNRLEAFSDGVLAIAITIMVLELEIPHGTELASLLPLVPKFLSYVLSFVYVGVYWNNHHHLFQLVRHVSGRVLWANQHLLFWLSMIPFVTAWSGENHFAPVTVAAYGAVLLMAAIAYFMLTRALISAHEADSPLARALGRDIKGKLSAVVYAAGIPVALVSPMLALSLYTCVALAWIVPDMRVVKMIEPGAPPAHR